LPGLGLADSCARRSPCSACPGVRLSSRSRGSPEPRPRNPRDRPTRLRGAPSGLFSSADRPAGWCSLIGVPAAGRGKRRRCRQLPSSPVRGPIPAPAFCADPPAACELRSTGGAPSAVSPDEADAGGIFGRPRRRLRCVRTLPSREALTPGPPSPAAAEASCGAESGPSAGGSSTAWISSPGGAASAVPVSGLAPRCRRRRRLEESPSPRGPAESSLGCGAAPASRGGRRRRRRRGRRGGSPPTAVSACGSALSFASESACSRWAEVAGSLSALAAGRAGDMGLTRSPGGSLEAGGSLEECDIRAFPRGLWDRRQIAAEGSALGRPLGQFHGIRPRRSRAAGRSAK